MCYQFTPCSCFRRHDWFLTFTESLLTASCKHCSVNLSGEKKKKKDKVLVYRTLKLHQKIEYFSPAGFSMQRSSVRSRQMAQLSPSQTWCVSKKRHLVIKKLMVHGFIQTYPWETVTGESLQHSCDYCSLRARYFALLSTTIHWMNTLEHLVLSNIIMHLHLCCKSCPRPSHAGSERFSKIRNATRNLM